ncbi:MAG: cell division protein ZapA [Bryobacterales bacterium]|nr:cell division protein ZapA [Bryobacterales bacterium]
MSSAADSRKRTYKVRIFQQTYSIVSSASEAEFQQIADHVDQLMHTIASRSGSTDGTRAAVMAAMHLADRLRHAEQRLESIHAEQRQALAQVGVQTGHLERLLRETLDLEDLSALEPDADPGSEGSALAAAPRAPLRVEPRSAPEACDETPAETEPPGEEHASRGRTRRERVPAAPTLFSMDGRSFEPSTEEE